MLNEDRFWSMIEEAWQQAGGFGEYRAQFASGDLSDARADELQMALEEVIPDLRKQLDVLTAEDLLEFDRLLEHKLYDLDREEVHRATDGSDDGFLYARGFIVALGRNCYEAVNRDPSKAKMDCECEEMCYLSFHVYRKKFGTMPKSGICRETGFNADGWKK